MLDVHAEARELHGQGVAHGLVVDADQHPRRRHAQRGSVCAGCSTSNGMVNRTCCPARFALDADAAAHQLDQPVGRWPAPARCRRSAAWSTSRPARTAGTAGRCASAGMPMPVSRDREAQPRAARRPRVAVAATTHLAVVGELHRVADQVRPASGAARLGSPATRGRHVGRSRSSASSRPFVVRACSANEVERRRRTHAGQVERRACSSSSLPASIFEKSRMSLMIVEQARRRERRMVSANSRCSASSGGVRAAGSVMPDHAVHRRADLVAHRGQELGLGACRALGAFLGLPELRASEFLAIGDVGDGAGHADGPAFFVAERAPALARTSGIRRCRVVMRVVRSMRRVPLEVVLRAASRSGRSSSCTRSCSAAIVSHSS